MSITLLLSCIWIITHCHTPIMQITMCLFSSTSVNQQSRHHGFVEDHLTRYLWNSKFGFHLNNSLKLNHWNWTGLRVDTSIPWRQNLCQIESSRFNLINSIKLNNLSKLYVVFIIETLRNPFPNIYEFSSFLGNY